MLREETASRARGWTWVSSDSSSIQARTRCTNSSTDEWPAFWLHTTDQVREWLKDRLPAALRSATPPEPEQVPASEVGAGDGEGEA